MRDEISKKKEAINFIDGQKKMLRLKGIKIQ